jgi:hypothetical protein
MDKRLSLRDTDDMIRVAFQDYELNHVVENHFAGRREYVLRRIRDAVQTDRTRDWRTVLGSDQE